MTAPLVPYEYESRVLNPAGWLRGIWLNGVPVTNLNRDPDDPYDPADDEPFTLISKWRITR